MATSASNSTAPPSGIAALRAQLQNLCMDALHDADCCGCGCSCHSDTRQDKAEEAGSMADTIIALVQQPQALGALVAVVCDLQLVPKEPQFPPLRQQVTLDFPHLGSAGPFPVVAGHVAIPDVTLWDLQQRMKPEAPWPHPTASPARSAMAVVEFTDITEATELRRVPWPPGAEALEVLEGQYSRHMVSGPSRQILTWNVNYPGSATEWAKAHGFKVVDL